MKEQLKQRFSQEYRKHYEVGLFKELGFKRRQCSSCKNHFWTLGQSLVCGDSSCKPYSFIGKRVTKKSFDYVQSWKAIEKFFVKEGHHSIPRYPVICRWFPGLYFTIAGIVAFQRLDGANTVFELPQNPVILPQLSIRFNDIPNVGITGRHNTSFVMVQQTSLYDGKQGYWKDRCIELDWRLLTEVFGIPKDEITFREDVWVGPNAFGPSLEYFAYGLELGNAVFTQFLGNPSDFAEMKNKVIDMGAGLERFAWLCQGTPSSYDSVFTPAIDYMKRCAKIADTKMLRDYAAVAGSLDVDSATPREKLRQTIAKQLGVSMKDLDATINPMTAIYAIADHTKTLLFAIADGAIPSNVGGGHNLRVILRRCLGFIDEYEFDFTLPKIASIHAKHLKSMYPELSSSLATFEDVVDFEREKYSQTMQNTSRIISKLEKTPSTQTLINLYQSHGITPELIQAHSKGISIPQDFYVSLTDLHEKEKPADELDAIVKDIRSLESTELEFYADQKTSKFTAKVLARIGDYVVLDRTYFYPLGGGQVGDTGSIENMKIADTQKKNGVVLHKVVGKNTLIPGQSVSCTVDIERRERITKHHTSIHIINASARKIIGSHIWQEGSNKTEYKASLDLTHYKPFTQQELEKIETFANEVIAKDLPVKRQIMPRMQAEQKYTLRIYQGGAVPSKNLRIIEIPGIDVEACAGTHVYRTGEIGRIVVTGSDRVKDGANRIEIVSGKVAQEFLLRHQSHALSAAKLIGSISFGSDSLKDPLAAYRQLRQAAKVFDVSPEHVVQTIERFIKEIKAAGQMQKGKASDLTGACEVLFGMWKVARKQAQKDSVDIADSQAQELLAKHKNSGMIKEILDFARPDLIKIASALIQSSPATTAILANPQGDIIVMSKQADSRQMLSGICEKLGGAGGGRPDFAQGKISPQNIDKLTSL